MFAAMNAGQSASLAPDYGKARVSAQRIFQLLDRKPLIDSSSEEGEKLVMFFVTVVVVLRGFWLLFFFFQKKCRNMLN